MNAQSSTTALVPSQDNREIIQQSPREITFSAAQVELIKKTIASGCSDDELQLFVAQCKRTGLDPFNRQIYAIKRYSKGGDKMTIQVSIDGLRLLAERTGQYRGQSSEQWCGSDGKWKDIWTSSEPPVAARVLVYREGWQPTEGKVLWREYCQYNAQGQPNAMWQKYPTIMLAKCAEARALRKVFPNELSGIYATEEIPSIDMDNGGSTIENKLQEIANYMKEHNISKETASTIARSVGLDKPANTMSYEELERVFGAMKESQVYYENHPNENIPSTSTVPETASKISPSPATPEAIEKKNP